MRSVIAIVSLSAQLAWPAEGIPHWSRVLDDVLKRAEAEASRTPREPVKTAELPVAPLHPAVQEFIRYYQDTGATTWSNSVRRLDEVRPFVEQTFREEGVPPELMWLGLVESGYRSSARSPKDAAGVWQFIPETARRFGLVVHGRRDERVDTEKATRAAAKYLRFLFDTFGDWNLSLAAYNTGEGRVQAAIDRAGTRDYWTLAEQGHLPRETRAYVPAVLAAQVLGGGNIAATQPARRMLEAPFSLSP